MKLLYAVILSLALTGCAGISKSLNDNDSKYRRAIKITTIIAVEKAENKSEFATKSNSAADKVIALMDSQGAVTKGYLLDRLRKRVAKKNISIGYKIILDELILIAEELLADVEPKADIPPQVRADIKKVAGYIKRSVSIYL